MDTETTSSTLEQNEILEPKESVIYPGFYICPLDTRLLVSTRGEVVRASDGFKYSPGQTEKDSYLRLNAHHEGKSNFLYLHRLLATTFVGRPFRHLDKDIENLEVNHIDGDKTNFDLQNLEWVTRAENLEHARRLGLIKIEGVSARNIYTNEIANYDSAEKCAEHFGFSSDILRRILRSEYAGRKTKSGWVFSWTGVSDWPELSAGEMVSDSWRSYSDIWVAKNQETDSRVVDHSLTNLCDVLGLDIWRLRAHRASTPETPFAGWFFDIITNPTIEEVSEAPERKSNFQRNGVKIKTTNLKTGEIVIFDTATKASKMTGFSRAKIDYRILRNNGILDDYLFEKIG